MKLTRRGLFGLGIGSALAAVVGKGEPVNESELIESYDFGFDVPVTANVVYCLPYFGGIIYSGDSDMEKT